MSVGLSYKSVVSPKHFKQTGCSCSIAACYGWVMDPYWRDISCVLRHLMDQFLADLVTYDWLCDLASRTYLLPGTFELLWTLEGHCKFGIMLWLYYLYVYILRFWRKLNTTTIWCFISAYISLGLASFGRDRAEFCAWRAYSLHRGLGEPSCA